MPTTIDLTTNVVNVMKTIYAARVNRLFYKKRPFLAMVPKEGGFTGTDLKVSVQHSAPQGLSHTFTDAQNNKSAGQDERFSVPRRRAYSLWEIDEETIEASQDSKGALVRLLRNKSDQAVDALSRLASRDVFGDTGGAIGQIGTPSGSTITLLNGADVVNWEIDMVVVASANDGTDAAHSLLAGGPLTVTKVSRDVDGNPLITFSSAVPGGWVANSYLFRQGDFKTTMHGLASWLPTNRAGAFLSTAYLGVDRSKDEMRLAGYYYDGSSSSIEETIKRLATRIVMNGGSPDTVLINPLDCETLEIEQESRVWRPERVDVRPAGKKSASIGFDVIMFRAGGHMMKLVQDVDCPRGRVYVLQMDTWKLHHLNALPHMAARGMGQGGGRAATNADSIEFRARYWANLACYAPGWNGVGILPS